MAPKIEMDKVVGVKFENRQAPLRLLYDQYGESIFPVDLVPDPENEHDAYAIRVVHEGEDLGFLPGVKSKWLYARWWDETWTANPLPNMTAAITLKPHGSEWAYSISAKVAYQFPPYKE